MKTKPEPRPKAAPVPSAIRKPKRSIPPDEVARLKAAAERRRFKPWEVCPDDLKRLDAVRSLLSALNNPYVSTRQIQDLVAGIPVLAVRCIRRTGTANVTDMDLLEGALNKIGNMGLERELLGLLEDLTACAADLADGGAEPAEGAETD